MNCSGEGVADIHEPLLHPANDDSGPGVGVWRCAHLAAGAQPDQRGGAGHGLGGRLPLLERRHAPRQLHQARVPFTTSRSRRLRQRLPGQTLSQSSTWAARHSEI